MKNIFCLLLFVVSFTAVMAQSKKQQEEKPALEQRVDSLQHELAFLKAKYELDQFNSEMQIYTCDIRISIHSMQITSSMKIFDSDLVASYQSTYESAERFIKISKERLDAFKVLIAFESMAYSFSDSEAGELKSKIETLDSNLNILDKYLYVYETSLDIYKKQCRE